MLLKHEMSAGIRGSENTDHWFKWNFGRGREGLGQWSEEGAERGREGGRKEAGEPTQLLLWALPLRPFPLLGSVFLNRFSDPHNILRDSSIDTRPVGLPTWEVSPGDDAMECSITDQGAPGVTLRGGRERRGVLGGGKQRHRWGHNERE